MEKGKKRQLSLPWELGLQRQREGVETASWLGQETPSRLGQRQALGYSCFKQPLGPGQGLDPGDSVEASWQGGFSSASPPDPDSVEPRPGPGRPSSGGGEAWLYTELAPGHSGFPHHLAVDLRQASVSLPASPHVGGSQATS